MDNYSAAEEHEAQKQQRKEEEQNTTNKKPALNQKEGLQKGSPKSNISKDVPKSNMSSTTASKKAFNTPDLQDNNKKNLNREALSNKKKRAGIGKKMPNVAAGVRGGVIAGKEGVAATNKVKNVNMLMMIAAKVKQKLSNKK